MHILKSAQQLIEKYPEVEKHSKRVALLALETAKLLNLPDPGLISQSAYLHDIGKTMWPPELFAKQPLLDHEWGIVKAHTIAGVNMIMEMWPNAPDDVLMLVRCHHERPNGKGYPNGIIEPTTETMLLAACDVYDAMTTERKYRKNKSFPLEIALLEIAKFAPAQIVAALAVVVIKVA